MIEALLWASPPSVTKSPRDSSPQAQAEFGETLQSAVYPLSCTGAPGKLILNEVMFGASIKNAMPGDQSTIFILEICCNHQEIQVSRPNVSSVTQSSGAREERVAVLP